MDMLLLLVDYDIYVTNEVSGPPTRLFNNILLLFCTLQHVCNPGFICMITWLQIGASITVFSEADISCGVSFTVKVKDKCSCLNKGRKR